MTDREGEGTPPNAQPPSVRALSIPSAADPATLRWVEAEVELCLQRARGALEAYADGGAAASHLGDCLAALHIARGALELVECQPAAMLLEELETILGGIAQGVIGNTERVADAAVRALIKISDYVAWLARGNVSTPLVLLPLFNDLRAARGAPLLSEGALFTPQLTLPQGLPTTRRAVSGAALQRLARSLRSQFQHGLVEWYRGAAGADVGLARIARVLAILEQIAGPDRIWPLWWVASGVVGALRAERLDDGPAVRRIVGQLDICLRALADGSVDPARLQPPLKLLKNLLFLATRVSSPSGKRIETIRKAYALAPYVPGDEQRQRAERGFSGPGAETLQALAVPLRAEMRDLQATLDAWARSRTPPSDHSTVTTSLSRLGDCFGLLNCGSTRRGLQLAAERLAAVGSGADSGAALASAAEALLGASDALEGMLAAGLQDSGDPSHESDTRRGALQEAVVVEIYINLAGAKHLLTAPTTAIDAGFELDRFLNPARGALGMLGMVAQAGMLARWRDSAVRILEAHGGEPPHSQLALLAEGLLAVERHLGGCIGREPRRESAAALVERRLKLLEAAAETSLRTRTTPPPVSSSRPGVHADLPDASGDADVLAVFLSECDELIEEIRAHAVSWADDPQDRTALLELRRAFHTLKGSGRLMGVRNLAELAMAVEQLLGRVVDGMLAPSPALHEALGEACQLLPKVIVAPGDEESPAGPVDDIVGRMQRLEDQPPATGLATPVLAAASRASRPTTSAEDQLQRLFVAETAEILDDCDAVMQKLKRDPADVALINELRREVHTLKGSAHVAGATVLGDLGHAMESALALLAEGLAPSSLAFLALMEECLDRLSDQLDLVRAGRPLAPVDDLVARIETCVHAGASVPPPAGVPNAALPLVLRNSVAYRDERIQVPIGLLDRLTGLAGELGVTQTQLAEGLSTLRASLAEMREAVRRVRTQARRLDRDTKPAAVGDGAEDAVQALQGERAASLRGLARAIAESSEDLHSLWQSLEAYADGTGSTVAQQSRAGTDLHNELTRARREPFSSYVPRLRRIVRRTLAEMGKQGELVIHGETVEVDRLLMGRLVPALEHMLRNAVAHGIESPAERRARGKPEPGQIGIGLERGSGELLIRMNDDGAGLQREVIHRAAVSRGLLSPDAAVDDPALDEMILRPGFSTATELTRFSGRGLGLDVASSLVRQLGGQFRVESEPGQGTCFTLQLPLDTTLKQVLLVAVEDSVSALLTSNVAGLLESEMLARAFIPPDDVEHEGLRYRRISLARLLGGTRRESRRAPSTPAVLVRAGEERFALLVDAVVGRQEVVLSALGPAPAGSRHAIGATILADGRPANVLDVPAVVRAAVVERVRSSRTDGSAPRRTPVVLVADDSITVRQVTSRVLGREGMEVITAKDGIETLALLRENTPDILVLDIEMPRMDGFQVASAVRSDPRLQGLPIVMVTSRVGPKHSERARALGVDRYLGKPYAEQELIGHIRALLDTAAASPARVSTGT